MDILACPMCRSFPLRLTVLEREQRYKVGETIRCELYCSFHEGMVAELPETRCWECYSWEILSGILTCQSCGRWYPIIDEIPIMLPDEFRDRAREKEFLNKWVDKIPSGVVRAESAD